MPSPLTYTPPKQILNLYPVKITLGNGEVATVYPTYGPSYSPLTSIPENVLKVLHKEFNDEIERGDTYPVEDPLTLDEFKSYWLNYFTAIMIIGEPSDDCPYVELEDLNNVKFPKGSEKNNNQIDEQKFIRDFKLPAFSLISEAKKNVLGTFYIKPNYLGRSNHNCNAGFLVSSSHRGKKIGSFLGKIFVNWAPKLGYKSSVYNLVYDTNIGSKIIWDKMGFKRVGLIPEAGRLKGHENLVDAIVYWKKFEPLN